MLCFHGNEWWPNAGIFAQSSLFTIKMKLSSSAADHAACNAVLRSGVLRAATRTPPKRYLLCSPCSASRPQRRRQCSELRRKLRGPWHARSRSQPCSRSASTSRRPRASTRRIVRRAAENAAPCAFGLRREPNTQRRARTARGLQPSSPVCGPSLRALTGRRLAWSSWLPRGPTKSPWPRYSTRCPFFSSVGFQDLDNFLGVQSFRIFEFQSWECTTNEISLSCG